MEEVEVRVGLKISEGKDMVIKVKVVEMKMVRIIERNE